MAKVQKGKAEAFIAEAEGMLAKKSWFSSSKERNAEEAAEIFEKAANAYKVGGLNQDAGNTYTKAAELYRDRLSDYNNASKAFNNAGTNRMQCLLLKLCIEVILELRGACIPWIVLTHFILFYGVCNLSIV